jgi:hypothetical protein
MDMTFLMQVDLSCTMIWSFTSAITILRPSRTQSNCTNLIVVHMFCTEVILDALQRIWAVVNTATQMAYCYAIHNDRMKLIWWKAVSLDRGQTEYDKQVLPL